LAYIISDEKNPTNHPIYAVDTDFGACILQIEESQKAGRNAAQETNSSSQGKVRKAGLGDVL